MKFSLFKKKLIAFTVNLPIISSVRKFNKILTNLNNKIFEIDARLEKLSNSFGAQFVVHSGNPTETLIRTNLGYMLVPSSDYFSISGLLEQGEYEVGTRLVINKLLSPGDIFVDVGAHFGTLSIAAAQIVGLTGKVFSFEPNPVNYQFLNKNVSLNGLSEIISTFELALSNKKGLSTMHLSSFSGNHTIVNILNTTEDQFIGSTKVNCIELDDFWDPKLIINLMKIDVEGAETYVFDGGKNTILKNVKNLIVEFAPKHLSRTNTMVPEWLEQLSNLGFKSFYSICESDGKLKKPSIRELTELRTVNLLFSKN